MTVPEQAISKAPENRSSQDDLASLALAFEVRKYHHNSIWEEQKHFSWLISILLSALVIGVTSDRLDVVAKDILIVAGSLIGVLLSFTAYRVQRREGEYFRNANESFVGEWNRRNLTPQLAPAASRANKPMHKLLISTLAGKAGVRDYFQVLFLSFAVTFAALTVYGVSLLWPELAALRDIAK